ncbi:unnamed protein product [Linum tenue]|uniref:VQ domain-containing protein n=1 Tax=Linum tenue TaxID=586396 RepID=A0AAV0JEP4_9ROSI|nr:unnamed protein product [Linum tenue]
MEGSSSNSAVGRALMNNNESQRHHLFPQSSPLASPNGNFSNTNGGGHQIPRSDYHHHHHHHMNPYPTTFVQANTSTFKQVVQILTGSADTAKQASSPRPQDPPPPPSMRGSTNFPIPPIRSIPNKKQQQQQQQQLYERRSNSFKHRSLMINTLLPAAGRFTFNSNLISSSSPSSASAAAEILSPSMLDFPKLTLSPVTPLNQDPFFHNHNSSSSSPCPSSAGNCSSSSSSSSPLEEEDRAIAEKGFYLHPSPLSTPRESEPQLLTLFPLTSPRAAESQPPEP